MGPFCPGCHNYRNNPNGRRGKCDHVFHSTPPTFGDHDFVPTGNCDKCGGEASIFERTGPKWCWTCRYPELDKTLQEPRNDQDT